MTNQRLINEYFTDACDQTGLSVNEIEVLKVDYKYENKRLTAELTLADNNKKYIIIYVNDMIFVSDNADIEATDNADIEAYDLTDGRSYYMASDYADEISDALLWLIAKYIQNSL